MGREDASFLPIFMEGTAEWLATGFERQGDVTVGGSIPLPSAHASVVLTATRVIVSHQFKVRIFAEVQ